MSDSFFITVNRQPIRVSAGTSVAAAIFMASEPCRFSASGQARGPLCGMGICMECRATVNGAQHQRTCQLLCTDGMQVVTG